MKSNEISFKSISMIEAKFKQYRRKPLLVPDWNVRFFSEDIRDFDILLMGSFFEKIFQPDYWPTNEFELFCLCSKTRQCLIRLFEFDPNTVGVINRYTLFQRAINQRNFEINPHTTFIYSGRISPQKNIEFLVFTFFYLQLFFSPKIKLKIFGNFDNIYHKNILGCHYIDYEMKLMKLISQLPWAGEKPEIIQNLNETEWLKQLPENGVFFSTSDLISEDFSVVAAQLSEIGYPMLLPFWGGFADVSGTNINHYSAELIANSHQNISIISIRAKKLALLITSNKFLDKKQNSEPLEYLPEIKINRKYLDSIYLKNCIKWGNEIQLLRDEKLPEFTKTDNGQKFFKEIIKLFSE